MFFYCCIFLFLCLIAVVDEHRLFKKMKHLILAFYSCHVKTVGFSETFAWCNNPILMAHEMTVNGDTPYTGKVANENVLHLMKVFYYFVLEKSQFRCAQFLLSIKILLPFPRLHFHYQGIG